MSICFSTTKKPTIVFLMAPINVCYEQILCHKEQMLPWCVHWCRIGAHILGGCSRVTGSQEYASFLADMPWDAHGIIYDACPPMLSGAWSGPYVSEVSWHMDNKEKTLKLCTASIDHHFWSALDYFIDHKMTEPPFNRFEVVDVCLFSKEGWKKFVRKNIELMNKEYIIENSKR